jgi:hypothetical protein
MRSEVMAPSSQFGEADDPGRVSSHVSQAGHGRRRYLSLRKRKKARERTLLYTKRTHYNVSLPSLSQVRKKQKRDTTLLYTKRTRNYNVKRLLPSLSQVKETKEGKREDLDVHQANKIILS